MNKPNFKSEQEKFWAGEFGDQYQSRNPENFEFGSRAALFSRILSRTGPLNSIIEFGPNIGNNLKVLRLMQPQAKLTGVEINVQAAQRLQAWGQAEVINQSILDFKPARSWDMGFVSGVLIHINPDFLAEVYRQLYTVALRYICLIEYYNPVPVEMNYRGHAGKLFKRDFCSEIIGLYPNLKMLDYGFVYHRDPVFPLDDLTWFLLEKR
ncbi:MAG TPA: pseudaminic acid biosynthesis-associated methylase [Desulfobacterales bacterium]|nr:pseudaminic acid biosynthesis-associated methylase [Desulfobacterales bacterium]